MRRLCICLFVVMFLAAGSAAQAAGCRGSQPFGAWIEEFTSEALAAGITRQTLASAQPYFIFDQSIVNKDRGQGVFAQSFLQFSDRMAAPYRIQKAGQLIQQHAAVFDRIEKELVRRRSRSLPSGRSRPISAPILAICQPSARWFRSASIAAAPRCSRRN